MGTTGLKQRLIKEDNDLGLISSEYAPRLDRTKSKVDSFEVTTLTPPPDSEWVRESTLLKFSNPFRPDMQCSSCSYSSTLVSWSFSPTCRNWANLKNYVNQLVTAPFNQK